MHLIVPLLLLSGCTAGRATYMMLNAQQSYQAALGQGAQDDAVYEITLAHEYLQKAREEAGYSQYGAVDELCRASMSWSQAAYKRSSDEGQIPDADQVVPEERQPEVAKPPTTGPEPTIDIDLDEP